MLWRAVCVAASVAMAVLVAAALASDVTETWAEYKARMDHQVKKKGKSPIKITPEMAELHKRQKRTIAFPSGSTMVITPILCIPVFRMGDISGILDMEFPFTMVLPNQTNINGVGRSNDRLQMYAMVEDSIDKMGLSGKACLLRAVCEVAESPLTDDGLLGAVVNIILSASVGDEQQSMQEYVKAEYRGKHYGDCWSAYPDCPVSLFKLFKQ